MTSWITIKNECSQWLDAVATAVGDVIDRYKPPPVVDLYENNDGDVELRTGRTDGPLDLASDGRLATADVLEPGSNLEQVLRGSRVNLFLQPDRFLFAPLDLPKQASAFLNGIVRSQIDRLTPWRASNAAFGWSEPVQSGPERITVTIAATGKATLAQFLQPITSAGAHSVAVFAQAPTSDAAAIKISEERTGAAPVFTTIRRNLIIVLAATAVASAVATAFSAIAGASLDARQQELSQQIVRARAAAAKSAAPDLSLTAASLQSLETRKRSTPSSLIVIEMLSRILPDHTYVTELRIEGTKLRLTGVTSDAPSLIAALERSGRFTQATFFAPTTRSSSENTERFHIEAQIEPLMAPRS